MCIEKMQYVSFTEDFVDLTLPEVFLGGNEMWCVLPQRLTDGVQCSEELVLPFTTEAAVPREEALVCEALVAKCKPGRKWTQEEDDKMMDLMRMYKEDWKAIAKKFPEKTPKQIKERWLNQLNPLVIDKPFSAEEDICLLMHIRAVGRSWSRISKFMPGRSELMVKNRYHSFHRKRLDPDVFCASFPLPDMDVLAVWLTKQKRKLRSYSTTSVSPSSEASSSISSTSASWPSQSII